MTISWILNEGKGPAGQNSYFNSLIKKKWVLFVSCLCMLDVDPYVVLKPTIASLMFTFLLFVLPLFACFSFPIQCQKLNTSLAFVVFSDRKHWAFGMVVETSCHTWGWLLGGVAVVVGGGWSGVVEWWSGIVFPFRFIVKSWILV